MDTLSSVIPGNLSISHYFRPLHLAEKGLWNSTITVPGQPDRTRHPRTRHELRRPRTNLSHAESADFPWTFPPSGSDGYGRGRELCVTLPAWHGSLVSPLPPRGNPTTRGDRARSVEKPHRLSLAYPGCRPAAGVSVRLARRRPHGGRASVQSVNCPARPRRHGPFRW